MVLWALDKWGGHKGHLKHWGEQRRQGYLFREGLPRYRKASVLALVMYACISGWLQNDLL